MEREDERRCACGTRSPGEKATACRACSRASSALHYARNRERVLGRYRDRKSFATPAMLQERRDRAYLATYIARGKVVPEACVRCGDGPGLPIQPELGAPLVVVWACSACRPRVRAELEGGIREAPAPALRPRSRRPKPTWARTFEDVEAIISAWPPARAADLRQRAAAFRGLTLPFASPLYRMRVVEAYRSMTGAVSGEE